MGLFGGSKHKAPKGCVSIEDLGVGDIIYYYNGRMPVTQHIGVIEQTTYNSDGYAEVYFSDDQGNKYYIETSIAYYRDTKHSQGFKTKIADDNSYVINMYGGVYRIVASSLAAAEEAIKEAKKL